MADNKVIFEIVTTAKGLKVTHGCLKKYNLSLNGVGKYEHSKDNSKGFYPFVRKNRIESSVLLTGYD